MRALRFDRFGEPDVLQLTDVPDPATTAAEATVRVQAASVNPSDVKNVAGAMQDTVLPRIPGRDFAGVVIRGPDGWRGVPVWGTGGDIGFTRDGSHAELLSVPIGALVTKPDQLGFAEASAVGVTFVTAWLGVVQNAQLREGETVVIFGVTGGVGNAVAQIAKALGAGVIGVGRHEPRPGTPAADVITAFVPLDAEVGTEVKRLTGGRGADVVYDAVGGVTTHAALASLAPRGRLVVVSAVGPRTVDIDLVSLYRNETRILGVNSLKLDLVASARVLEAINPYFQSGAFRPPPIAGTYPLQDGVAAYQAVAKGSPGRIVIQP